MKPKEQITELRGMGANLGNYLGYHKEYRIFGASCKKYIDF